MCLGACLAPGRKETERCVSTSFRPDSARTAIELNETRIDCPAPKGKPKRLPDRPAATPDVCPTRVRAPLPEKPAAHPFFFFLIRWNREVTGSKERAGCNNSDSLARRAPLATPTGRGKRGNAGENPSPLAGVPPCRAALPLSTRSDQQRVRRDKLLPTDL